MERVESDRTRESVRHKRGISLVKVRADDPDSQLAIQIYFPLCAIHTVRPRDQYTNDGAINTLPIHEHERRRDPYGGFGAAPSGRAPRATGGEAKPPALRRGRADIGSLPITAILLYVVRLRVAGSHLGTSVVGRLIWHWGGCGRAINACGLLWRRVLWVHHTGVADDHVIAATIRAAHATTANT